MYLKTNAKRNMENTKGTWAGRGRDDGELKGQQETERGSGEGQLEVGNVEM